MNVSDTAMKRILPFLAAGAVFSLPASAAEVRVELGRLSVPDVPVEFRALAHLPG